MAFDIPQYPMKRLRYFNNQFLNEQDFIDEQAFHLGHERAQLRALCVAGVWEGLAMTFDDVTKLVSVAPGIAADKYGRMVVLDAPAGGPAPGALGDGDYVLHIKYTEAPSDMAPPVAGGAQDNTRWHSEPVIAAVAKNAALPDGAIALGSFTVAGGAIATTSVTTAGCQYSGLRLPGPNKNVAATLRNNGAADDLAVLTGSLTVRRDVAAKLGPTLTLLNGSGGAGAGASLDFDGYDPGSNDPALRVQSIDDGNFSSHLAFATKQAGATTNKLVERLRLTSDGLLRFPNDAPKDKLVIYDNGATDRYGIGLNGGNINLFCPTGARFSLRQNSSSGTEVFSVSGAGAATFYGPIIGGLSIQGAVDVSATGTTWGGWLEAIRFSRPEHSAITHPGGKLLFGMHNNRNFYFSDTNAGLHLVTISPVNGGSLGIGTNGPPERPLHVKSSLADWQVRFENDSSTSNVYLAHGGGYGMHVRTDTAAPNNYLLQLFNNLQGGSLFHVATSGAVTIAKTLTVNGAVNATAGMIFEGAVAHIERDGALYRNIDGQCYLTVDDNLYIRDTNAATWAAHFDTNVGNLDLKGKLAATSLDIRGYGILTDPLAKYNCHFPSTDNNSYVTGDNIYLRGGAPTGFNIVLTATSGGRVGIGTTGPKEKLHVSGGIRMDLPNGMLRFTNIFQNYVELESNGQLWGINKWLSQRAAKKNIEDLDKELDTDKLHQLRPVAFNWANEIEGAPKTIGLIAEEVEAVLPQLVMHDGAGKPFAVDYSLLTIILLNEFKKAKKG